MADPNTYTPGYDFSDFSAHSPNSQQPGDRMDVEFENISDAIGSLVDAVKDVRRSDGALKNGIVTYDSLSAALILNLGAVSASQILAALVTVDGAGSGLDADLLDGHSSGYFQVQSANLDAWSAVNPSAYLTTAAAAAAYQPLSANLTSWALVSPGSYYTASQVDTAIRAGTAYLMARSIGGI